MRTIKVQVTDDVAAAAAGASKLTGVPPKVVYSSVLSVVLDVKGMSAFVDAVHQAQQIAVRKMANAPRED